MVWMGVYKIATVFSGGSRGYWLVDIVFGIVDDTIYIYLFKYYASINIKFR